MKLEDQVVSLELAKRLKELCVKQESIFWWGGIDRMSIWCDHVKNDLPEQENRFTWIPAYTVAELGEMLPIEVDGNFLLQSKINGFYNIEYSKNNFNRSLDGIIRLSAINEAHARGSMVIYLIENNFLDPKNLLHE